MASGTAYRCKVPNHVVLPFDDPYDPKPAKKLYKARRSKPPKPLQKRSRLMELPLELLHLVFLELDLPSIGMLRRANRTARLIVESLPEYSLLRKHASDTLRLMDTTKCSRYFSIGQLFTEFCQPRCRTCGDFGPFLYFPTATRSCYKCNYLEAEYDLAPTPWVYLHFALLPKQIKPLPIIYNIETRGPRRFVNITQAKALALQVHGSDKAIDRAYQTTVMAREERYRSRFRRWDRNGREGRAPAPPADRYLMKLNDGGRDTSLRMRATALFPYWDRQTRTLEPGVYCRACSYDAEEGVRGYLVGMGTIWDHYPARGEDYHRAFLKKDIPEHFLNCTAFKKNYDFRVRGKFWYGSMRMKRRSFIVEPKNIAES